MKKLNPYLFGIILWLVVVIFYVLRSSPQNAITAFIYFIMSHPDVWPASLIFMLRMCLNASLLFVVLSATFNRSYLQLNRSFSSPYRKAPSLLGITPWYIRPGRFGAPFLICVILFSPIAFLCLWYSTARSKIAAWRAIAHEVSLRPRVKRGDYREAIEYERIWQVPQYAVPRGARVNDFVHLVSVHYNGGLLKYFCDHLNVGAQIPEIVAYYAWTPLILYGIIQTFDEEYYEPIRIFYIVMAGNMLLVLPYIIVIYWEFTCPVGQAQRNNGHVNWVLLGIAVTLLLIIGLFVDYDF